MTLKICRYILRAQVSARPVLTYSPNGTNGSGTPIIVHTFINTTATSTTEATQIGWFAIIVPIICTFGIVGNALNLLILTRRGLTIHMDRLERCANYGLIALAVSDMGFCSAAIPFTLVNMLLKSNNFFVIVSKIYGLALINLFLMTSTWLIAAMAISRYIVVVYPIHARSTLGIFRTTVMISSVYLFSTIITLPHFINYSVEPCFDNNSIVWYQLRRTFDMTTTLLLRFYIRWLWPVVAEFLPLLILVFCNYRLIRELRHASKARRISCRGQRVRDPSQKVTLTLVIIVLMLLILVSPAEILKYSNPYLWGDVGIKLADIANLMQTVNFAFNFVLYCVLSPKFRETIKSLFNCFSKDMRLKELNDKTEMQTMITTTNNERFESD